MTITASPANPKVGDTVTFHVVAQDDESLVVAGNPSYGDSGTLAKTDGVAGNAAGYGPWDPPPLRPSTFDSSVFAHTYQQAGTFHVRFSVKTSSWRMGDDCPGDVTQLQHPDGTYPCVDPYLENSFASVDITVS